MTRHLLLLLLLLSSGLLLLSCRGSMVIGPQPDDDDSATDDDDSATGDDDDVQPDDDDVGPDDDDLAPNDDDVGPADESGFFIWDATAGENGAPGPTYAYMMLPRESLWSCQQWLQNEGEDVDYDYIAVWAVKGPTATWEGPYAEIYSPFCDYEDAGSRCFSAWGYDGSWQDDFESGNNDELVVDSWSGEVATGTIEIGDLAYSFRAQNCGEFDFADDDDDDDEGNDTNPDPGGAREMRADTRSAEPARLGGWKLRFR